jgi:hypothetical protein
VTAEIAIMNKNAVALAADSAVTIQLPVGQKIYNTNKLFALSKHHPVGVMVYDLAEFMGVPWEALIKDFRSELGRKSFGSLREYVEYFLSFLKKKNNIITDAMQNKYFIDLVRGIFELVRSQIEENVRARLAGGGSLTYDEVKQIAASTLAKCHSEATGSDLLPHLKNLTPNSVCHKYWVEIVKAKKEIFQRLPMPADVDNTLEEIIFAATCREWAPQGKSGIVFAGYGQNEIFPSIISFNISQIFDGHVKRSSFEDMAISLEQSASITPFAQADMAQVFMEGVAPSYRDMMERYLQKIFQDYPDQLLTLVPHIDPAKRSDLLNKMRDVGTKLFDKFVEDTRQYRSSNYVHPVVSAIAFLSKDMLAEVAESLVNLTSFKRRISINTAETVGGPVDVAVISKGDGFIWIKRKHYFKPEMNHRFLQNYSGE